jgi:ABC-type branched-subunit amino acid transport system permease subunit
MNLYKFYAVYYAFFSKTQPQKLPMSLEVFFWIILGGMIVAGLGAGSVYYLNETPSNKQLTRDFIIGAFFTGFLYPLIPESFNEMKDIITSTAGDLQQGISSTTTNSGNGDPGVKIGPADF